MNPMISPPIFPISDSCFLCISQSPGFSGSGTQPGRQVAERTRTATPLLRGPTDRRGGRRATRSGLWEKWGGSWSNQRKMPWVQILICVQNPKSPNESGDFKILASRPGGLSGKDGEAEENGGRKHQKHGNFTDKQVQNKNYSKLGLNRVLTDFSQSHGVPLILPSRYPACPWPFTGRSAAARQSWTPRQQAETGRGGGNCHEMGIQYGIQYTCCPLVN